MSSRQLQKRGSARGLLAILVAFLLVAGACSSDDSADSTREPATSAAPADTGPTETSVPSGESRPSRETSPPGVPDMSFSVTVPALSADTRLGDSVVIGASVLSATDIARLELWDGAEMVDGADVEPSPRASHVWRWHPLEAGIAGLVVRAVDVRGAVGVSPPTWVRVVDTDIVLPAGEEAAWSRGNRRDTNVLAVSVDENTCDASVDLAPNGPATTLFAATFGGDGFQPVAHGDDGGTVEVSLGAAPVMIYAMGSNGVSAPSILHPPSPCARMGWSGDLSFDAGLLANPSGADSAYLYLSFDEETWQRVPEADQTFVAAGGDGRFDFGPWMPPVKSGDSMWFEAWGWKGGSLTPLGASHYTAPNVGGGSGPGAVALPSAVGPVVVGADFDWVTGPATLVRDGVICTFEPGGPVGTLNDLPDFCTNGPAGVIPETFRWGSLPGPATHGILQASFLPPPSNSSLSFPGLVHMQDVPVPTAASVDFPIDIGAILDPPPVTKSASLPGPGALTFQMIGDLSGSPAGQSSSISFVPPDLVNSLQPETLYLRVVPMDGAQPLPGPTNLVTIDLVRDAPPPLVDVELASLTLDVEMTPPRLPNENYERCVRVVDNPWAPHDPAPSETPEWLAQHPDFTPAPAFQSAYGFSWEQRAFSYENGVQVHKGLIPGATVCATHGEPASKSWWEKIVDAVATLTKIWDFFVDVYDKLKDKIAEGLVFATGCEAIASHDVCQGLADGAVAIGLTAVGMPPTLPTFKEAVEAAKGDLAAAVVDASGVCDNALQSQCEDLAEDMLGDLLDEVQEIASQAALQSAVAGSNWALFLHPGITVIPEPAGTLSPAVFDVTLTRSAVAGAPAPPPSCTMTATVLGQKDSYEWFDYSKGDHIGSGPVAATVMVPKSVGVDLTDLAPGESKHVVIALDKVIPWYLPGQSQNAPYVPSGYTQPSTWIFFNFGDATLTDQITTCAGSKSQAFAQDNKGTEPWEIPHP